MERSCVSEHQYQTHMRQRLTVLPLGGRRLLEPRGPDGYSTNFTDGTVEAKNHFIRTFDWAAVKNYNVDIVLENRPQRPLSPNWDEEVEVYDIRGESGNGSIHMRLTQHRLCRRRGIRYLGKVSKLV